METRKERRKAEKLKKRKMSKFVRSNDPVKRAIDEAKLFFPRTEFGDFVGIDKQRKYVGEVGPVSEAWQAAHATCNHGFITGDWWYLLDGGEYVSVRTKEDGTEALLAAGAYKVRSQIRFGDEDNDEEPVDEVFVILGDLAEFGGYNSDGVAAGEGGQVTEEWLDLLGDQFPFQKGSFWAHSLDDRKVRECRTLEEAHAVLFEAGVTKIASIVELVSPPVP